MLPAVCVARATLYSPEGMLATGVAALQAPKLAWHGQNQDRLLPSFRDSGQSFQRRSHLSQLTKPAKAQVQSDLPPCSSAASHILFGPTRVTSGAALPGCVTDQSWTMPEGQAVPRHGRRASHGRRRCRAQPATCPGRSCCCAALLPAALHQQLSLRGQQSQSLILGPCKAPAATWGDAACVLPCCGQAGTVLRDDAGH